MRTREEIESEMTWTEGMRGPMSTLEVNARLQMCRNELRDLAGEPHECPACNGRGYHLVMDAEVGRFVHDKCSVCRGTTNRVNQIKEERK